MANRRIEIDIVANVRALNRALSGAAPAVRQAATNFQRVYERAFAGINRAEEQRRRASEQAANQTARAHAQAARQQQRVYEQAFAAIQRAEQRRARESQRIAEQLARQQQQAARDAQRQQSGGTGFGSLVGAGTLSGLAVSGITAAFGAFTDAVQRAAQAYRDFMAEGVRFNATLESTALAIQSLIADSLLGSGGAVDAADAFAKAEPVAADQLRKLKMQAIETSATFEDLALAFQDALGVGLSKGFSPDQIRELTVKLGQAARTANLPGYQLPQEIRAVLSGQIDRNARVGMRLFNTEEDRKKLKELLNTDVNAAYEFINSKLKGVTLGGQLAAKTFEGLLGSAKEVFTLFASESSLKTFQGLKSILSNIIQQFVEIKRNKDGVVTDVRLAEPFQRVANLLDRIGEQFTGALLDGINYLVAKVREFTDVLAKNPDVVNALIQDFRDVFDAVLDIGRAALESFNFDDPRDGLILIRSILQSIRIAFLVIADLVGVVTRTIGTAVNGAAMLRDYIRDVGISTQNFLNGLSGALNQMQGLVPYAAQLANLMAAAASAFAFLSRGPARGTIGEELGIRKPSPDANKTLADSYNAMLKDNRGGGGGRTAGGGGGGKGSDPAAEAIAQRRAEMQRNFEFQKTLLESAQKIAKQKIDEETEANEAAHEDRLISLETYLAKKAELTRRSSALEIAAIELEKKAETERYELAIDSFNQAKSIKDPKKRAAAERKADEDLQDSRNKLLRLEADLTVARSKSAQTGAQNEREITRAVREQQQAYEDLETQIKELEGKRFEAARDRINAEADAAIDRIRSKVTIGQDGAPQPQPLTKAEQREIDAINRKRELNLANLNIQEKAAAVQATIAQIAADQAEIQLILQQNGGVQLEQDRARLQVLRDRIALLQSQRADLATAIQANPTAENQQVLTDVDGQIRGLGNTSMTVAGQIRQNLYGAFTNLFQGLMSGSQSAGQAFAAFAQQVIGSIQQMIAQMIAMWIVQKLIGLAFSAAGALGAGGHSGVTGGLGGVVGAGHGMASGGLVTGPGGPKSDRIPAMLSNGEFVVNAAAVQRNRALLEAMNSGGSVVPNLGVSRLNSPAAPMGEDGVGMGGVGGRQRIELNNVIIDERKSVGEYMQSASGQRDVVSVIQRNARTIRAALELG